MHSQHITLGIHVLGCDMDENVSELNRVIGSQFSPFDNVTIFYSFYLIFIIGCIQLWPLSCEVWSVVYFCFVLLLLFWLHYSCLLWCIVLIRILAFTLIVYLWFLESINHYWLLYYVSSFINLTELLNFINFFPVHILQVHLIRCTQWQHNYFYRHIKTISDIAYC